MFPFTLSELGSPIMSTLKDLLNFGGFPEPFLLASEKESRRWSREYRFHMDLRYFRDVDRREVDFVILKDGQPTHFIECKKAGRVINSALRYLKRRFPDVKTAQISLDKDLDLVTKDDIRLCSAHKFLA